MPPYRVFLKNTIEHLTPPLFKRQKALGKGGHHLGLFDPTTHHCLIPETPERDPPHKLGPPVIGIAMPSKLDIFQSGGNTYN